MTRREYEKNLSKAISESMGPDYDICFDQVTKNNDARYAALRVGRKESGCYLALNVDDLYERHLAGAPWTRQREEILRALEDRKETADQIKETLQRNKDFSKGCSKVVFRLVNYEKNEEYLKTVPHRRFADLAVTYSLLLMTGEEECMSLPVSEKLMEIWKTDEETLHRLAMVNTRRELPVRISSLKIYPDGEIRVYEINLSEKEEKDVIGDSGTIKGYHLTNTEEYLGAAVILYPNVLEKVADRINRDLVVLPMNQHMILVLPFDASMDLEELLGCVQRENQETRRPEDVLSEHIYCYMREEKELRIARDSDFSKSHVVTVEEENGVSRISGSSR